MIPTEKLEALIAAATSGPWHVWRETIVCGPDKQFLANADAVVRSEITQCDNASLIALTPTLATEVLSSRKRIAELVEVEAALRSKADGLAAALREMKAAHEEYGSILKYKGIGEEHAHSATRCFHAGVDAAQALATYDSGKAEVKEYQGHWCRACREAGLIHCSDPVNCGSMKRVIWHREGCRKINCTGCGTDFHSVDYSGKEGK